MYFKTGVGNKYNISNVNVYDNVITWMVSNTTFHAVLSLSNLKLEFEINMIIQKDYISDKEIAWMVFNTTSHAVKHCHH